MTQRLAGKVAVVTGAGSGIGAASARRFAEEGAKVVLVDLNADGIEAETQKILDAGGTAMAVPTDVTSLEACDAMAAAAAEAYGPVDVLYANAGIAGTGNVVDCTPEMWDKVIAVMLTGVWYSQRAIAKQMVDNGGGSIINQASIGGIIGVKGIFPYAAAKAGVIGMTKQSAVEMGQHGIRFNAIAPGTAPTPLVTATTYRQANAGEIGPGGWEYSRSGNPTRAALETALAGLEGITKPGCGALAFASGLAATTCVIQTLSRGTACSARTTCTAGRTACSTASATLCRASRWTSWTSPTPRRPARRSPRRTRSSGSSRPPTPP